MILAEGYVTLESPLSILRDDESCAWALVNGALGSRRYSVTSFIHLIGSACGYRVYELSTQPCLPCSYQYKMFRIPQINM